MEESGRGPLLPAPRILAVAVGLGLLGGSSPRPTEFLPADWRAVVIWMNSTARKFVCFGWGFICRNYIIIRTDCFAVLEDISGSNKKI